MGLHWIWDRPSVAGVTRVVGPGHPEAPDVPWCRSEIEGGVLRVSPGLPPWLRHSRVDAPAPPWDSAQLNAMGSRQAAARRPASFFMRPRIVAPSDTGQIPGPGLHDGRGYSNAEGNRVGNMLGDALVFRVQIALYVQEPRGTSEGRRRTPVLGGLRLSARPWRPGCAKLREDFRE